MAETIKNSTLVKNLDSIKTSLKNIRDALKTSLNINVGSLPLNQWKDEINKIKLAPYSADNVNVEPGKFGKKGANVSLTQGNMMYYNGDFKAYRVINAVWNDYAEFFKSEGAWDYGDIIELNPKTGNYRRATSEDSNLVVGVASDSYGSIVGGEFNTIEENLKSYVPVGLMGRVNVKIKGSIKAGDLISVSDEPGIGKKSDGRIGTVVGKALVSSSDEYNIIPMLIVRG